jgi:glycerol-3-phosphate dehydrogenase
MDRDVTIIGGGVIGCAIARELARYRLRTLLVEAEAEVGFGTSKANSGIIHAGHHSSSATLKGRLEWAGNRRWDDLAADLGFGFERVGDLTVAFTSDEVATLRELHAQGERAGVTGLELWGPERLRAEEPHLSRGIVAALHAPTAGVVNPYEACFALVENAVANGLEVACDEPVVGVAGVDGGIVVTTSKRSFTSRFVVNAAGLAADRVADLAGVRTFALTARKGEEYLLDKRLQGLVSHIVFPCPTPTSKGILVIPTFDGTLMVGPTATEVDDRDDLTTTARGADAVFAAVTRLVPGVSAKDCIAEFAGVRAVSDTEDFVIEPTALHGFVNVAGIQSPGLTAAPAIADLVIEILNDLGAELEPDPTFRPGIDRPVHVASLTLDERAELADTDPRYAHVVCRCELVTEGEIADAIERGARTLDGLKFRTRAGMGRCQGGFCTWRCMQLLAGPDGDLSSVTKRGGDSWIVLPRDDVGTAS